MRKYPTCAEEAEDIYFQTRDNYYEAIAAGKPCEVINAHKALWLQAEEDWLFFNPVIVSEDLLK